jgi:undecaprenyl diphosphate synthase
MGGSLSSWLSALVCLVLLTPYPSAVAFGTFGGSEGARSAPQHVALVLDGNGRWADQRGLPRTMGHAEGAKRALETVELCHRLGVRYLTLFVFSSENWQRPPEEVSSLMQLLEHSIRQHKSLLRKNGIRLSVIGQHYRLPRGLRDVIAEVERDVMHAPHQMTLCLAVSYGGKNDILQAAMSLARAAQAGELDLDLAGEDVLEGYLSTGRKDIPDPDLIIRTANEHRLSNFYLYQAAYSELYISPKLWPDWRDADLLAALDDYKIRDRRFGRVQGSRSGQVRTQ